MLKTLQLYISRELLKTFALAAIGLTLTFSLTDGVFNMMRAEGLSAVQMLHLMGYILPFSLTLTLPLSALFSCAMVYGRLAADNEFDACRASGINIHRLLLPAFALSVFTCVFSLVSLNYVLPKCIRNLEQLVQKELHDILVNALSVRGFIRQGDYAFHTAEPPQTALLPDGSHHVTIDAATFLKFDGERLSGMGTAERADVIFWNDEKTGDPVAQAEMHNIHAFDLEQKRLVTFAEQRLEPKAVPMSAFTEQKTRWLNLSELWALRQDPRKLGVIQRQMTKLRTQIRQALFYDYVVKQLTTGDRVLRLGGTAQRPRYEIRAERAENTGQDFKPQIDRVTVKEALESSDRQWQAGRCIINVSRGLGPAPFLVTLHLEDGVVLTTTKPERKQYEKPPTDMESVPLPKSVLDGETAINDFDLLGIDPDHLRMLAKGKLPELPPSKYYLGDHVENLRKSTLKTLSEQALQIIREIHSRLAYNASVLVMLVLAAALAIIFRGGQLLTAFMISFLPGLVVFVLNITGRQLAVRPDLHLVGLAVIWSGIGLLALADLVVLSKFLKR